MVCRIMVSRLGIAFPRRFHFEQDEYESDDEDDSHIAALSKLFLKLRRLQRGMIQMDRVAESRRFYLFSGDEHNTGFFKHISGGVYQYKNLRKYCLRGSGYTEIEKRDGSMVVSEREFLIQAQIQEDPRLLRTYGDFEFKLTLIGSSPRYDTVLYFVNLGHLLQDGLLEYFVDPPDLEEPPILDWDEDSPGEEIQRNDNWP